jgi:uncharacterized protein (TIGR02246 family)
MADYLPDSAVRALYRQLLDRWDRRDALGMAALFAEDGCIVGFDGSAIDGRVAIEAHLRPIFAHHPTPTYIAKMREVRVLAPDVVLLRAVAGMVPRDKYELNPDLNAIQSLIAREQNDGWRIELFQNTPAAFHGQPELSQRLTDELRALLHDRGR